MCPLHVSRRALLTAGLGALTAGALSGCTANPMILAAGAGGAQAVGGSYGGSCGSGPTGRPPWQTPRVLPSGATEAIIAEQAANVAIMLNVLTEEGITRNGVIATLITAFCESYALTDLTGFMGWDRDHTSYGIFQQQDWWGTVEERMDPATSTRLFLHGKPGIPGLLSFDYETMEPWTVAQEVQRSAYPERYQEFMDVATAILVCSNSSIVVSGDWSSPMPAGAYLTSPFGPRYTPVVDFHAGIDLDFGVGDGIPLYALTHGTVVDEFFSPGGGYVTTFAWDGGMYSTYLHQQHASPLVSVGSRVEPGTHVGSMGNTGASTGSHLHFEIGPGVRMGGYGLVVDAPQDPAAFLAAQGITFPTVHDLFS